MKKQPLQGYILEEVIAHLIKKSGYSLIDKPPKGDPDIVSSYNGLNVKGRGTKHQIDVLGEMDWIPSFHFPSRLIIEAKFQSKPVGIDVVRSEVGILHDINENYFVTRGSSPRPRYRYNSVIVSTSGFTEPSVDMAIAHQIQLVDFSGAEYETIRKSIENLAEVLTNSTNDGDLLKRLKINLRSHLNNENSHETYGNEIDSKLFSLKESVRAQGELFIGMSHGGFMLLMKPDNHIEFISHAKKYPNHDVVILWTEGDGGKVWTIEPCQHPQSYKLTFRLPSKLHNWIFKVAENKYQEAINQKELSFSKISTYYKDINEHRDFIFNLKFTRDNLKKSSRGGAVQSI
jgi:hypothetical protein